MTRGMAGGLFGLLFLYWAAPAFAGPAVDQFEMKDLDSEPGAMQFQSQNAVSTGLPQRGIAQPTPGHYAFDDNPVAKARYALEMQMGITSWLRTRLGVEFEKSRLDDPGILARANAYEDLQLASVQLEGVLVFKPVKNDGIGLGLLTEFDSAVGASGGGKQLYIGPIVQAASGPWTAIANLLLVQHFGSTGRLDTVPADRSVDFAYALQLQYEFSKTWAVAAESYGTFDRIAPSGSQDATLALFGRFDQHRAGPVVYYRFDPDPSKPAKLTAAAAKGLSNGGDDDRPGAGGSKETSVSIGVGVLFGLNPNTPGLTYKLSLEYNF